MADPVRKLNDAELQRALAELAPTSGLLSGDDLRRLREFVEHVGGIDAARGLLETLGDLSSADGDGEIDFEDIDRDVDLADLDDEAIDDDVIDDGDSLAA